MRIGILTGGGDVPGLNPCIKALVYRAIDEGYKPIGIRRGWHGLLHYNPDDPAAHEECTVPLEKIMVRTIDRTGGTYLHSSRTNPGRVRPSKVPDFLRSPDTEGLDDTHTLDFTSHVLSALEHLRIDALIPIGGEDTLGYAARIHRENFPVVSIPKTMDNDVFGTDFCIGFSTAITRSVDFIHQLRSTAASHERIGVIELFGRHSGETSLISAYLAGADRAVISEVPFDIERLADLLMQDKAANPSHYALMTISEGAREM
jgi:6-phosphofructokinase 1